MDQNQNTEEKILRAAEVIFLKKGMDGARMQDIADEAGINKALLHYYFRSKEKLFNAIFTAAFQQFIPKLDEVMQNKLKVEEVFKMLANLYLDLLSQKPHLPAFIISELNRNPDQIRDMMLNRLNLNRLVTHMRARVLAEKGDAIDPIQIVVSIISAILFPFVARPLLTPLLFNDNSDEFEAFIAERRVFLSTYIDHLFQLSSSSTTTV